MKKKITIVLVIAFIFGIGIYLYMYKQHRDISSENADYSLTVHTLQTQFTENGEKANKMYADKTIEVNGKITAIDLPSHAIIVDEKLSAIFKDSVLPKLTAGKAIKIKGRFVGYDDLLEEFKMDEAALSE